VHQVTGDMTIRRILSRAVPSLAGLFVLAGCLAAGVAVAAPPEQLPVPTVTIYPGDMISADMLSVGTFPAGTADNFPVIASRRDIVGKVARRTLLPGRLIVRNTVGEPDLVEKGKIIPIHFQEGPLEITASVLALQSGAFNDMIQVRNIDSGKVIVATVAADGSVRVDAR
jgi:flagella basal body P-ring formation protein FlgA